MKPTRRSIVIVCLSFLFTLFVLYDHIAAQEQPSPQAVIEQAWKLAQANGRYHYSTQIDQTTYPVPRLTNAGKAPTQNTLTLEGQLDSTKNIMEMTLWQNGGGNPNEGVSIRVEAGRAYGRVNNGEWEEVDNITDIFAPGGDPLAFLSGVANAQEGETRNYSVNSNTATQSLTQYTFDLNGVAFAHHLRQQMEAQLRQQGKLPAGLELSTSDLYRQMTGKGELWIDAHGLPARLSVTVEFPPLDGNGRTTATITTDYFGFDQERTNQAATHFLSDPKTWITHRLPDAQTQTQIATDVMIILVVVILVVFVLIHWRSRKLYTAVALFIISSMLFGPLLQNHQVHAFLDEQQARQTAHETRTAEATQIQKAQEALQDKWNPHQPPIHNSQFSLQASTTITTTDTDGDGLSDADEDNWYTCAYAGALQNCTGVVDSTDSDNDGLSDGVEVNNLGIMPTRADTDGDTITDTLEVQGFDYGGTTWYLDPLEDDTNSDGLPDGIECPAWSVISDAFNLAGICPDTDGDGTPDVFDGDNDGDGVDDAVDFSPQIHSSDTFNDANPFQLTINNLEINRPVFVDFQLTPTDKEHLSYYTRILDWPANDFAGQIQRGQDTTFATSDNPDIVSNDGNAAYGDIRFVPMLEISMPYSAGHYANLPVNSTYNGIDRTLGVTVSQWLDTTELEPFGITVRDTDTTSGDLTAYVPLSLVTDAHGGGIQAFGARMLYYPEQGTGGVADWGSAHDYRLVWLVQMITDECDDGTTDLENCSRVDTLDVIQIYEEEWTLTGLSVTEEHGMDVAILYEDPAQDSDLGVDDQLWLVSWNLNNTFLRGRDCDSIVVDQCQSVNGRDVTLSNLASQIDSWSGGNSIVQMQSFNYLHSGYLAHISMTETVKILDDTFTPYADQTNPTLMFVQEKASRSLNVEQAVTSFTNAATLDLDPNDVEEVIVAGMSWAPYHYVSGVWQPYDLADYLALLEYNLSQDGEFMTVAAAEKSTYTAKAAPREATAVSDLDPEQQGKLLWSKTYYTSLYQGNFSIVEQDNETVWRQSQDLISEVDYQAIWATIQTGINIVAGEYAYVLSNMIGSIATSYKTPRKWVKFYTAFNASSFDLNVGRELLLIQKISNYAIGATVTLTAVGASLIVAGFFTKNDTVSQAGIVIATVGALIIESARMAMLISQARAILASTTGIAQTLDNLAGVAKTARSLAKVTNAIAFTAIWGLFFFQWGTGAFELGSNEFNQALALSIAGTIVLLIFIALEFIPIIGPFITIFLAIIDLVLAAFGETGFSVWLTEAIADLLYDVDLLLANLDDPDRLETNLEAVQLLDDSAGFTVGNSINYVMGVTNTLHFHDGFSHTDARRSTFRYFLRTTDADMHAGLNANDMAGEWVNLPGRYIQTAVTTTLPAPIPLTDIGSGINRSLDGNLYLIEAFVEPYEGCWLAFGFEADCDWYYNKGSSPLNIGESAIYDILPDTIGEFVSLMWNRNGALSFPAQRDADSDGMFSKAQGGADPDDTKYDTDGDGLSDTFEIINGTDPESVDTDQDNLSDKEELTLGTNPLDPDPDQDGLNDYIEVVQGWLVVYDTAPNGDPLLTRVWSDPFIADADGDALGDLEEFVFGFNPWVETDPSIIDDIVAFDDMTVAEDSHLRLLTRFEEGAGATVFSDSSGSAHTAVCDTSSNACPVVDENGRYGTALSFDGTDDRLTIADTDDLDLETMTLSLWVRPTQTNSGWTPLLTKEAADGSQRNYGLFLPPNSLNVNFNAQMADCSSWLAGLNSAAALTLDEWNHVGLTYDGATFQLYINGAADNILAYTGGLCQNDHPLKLGDEISAFDAFAGRLDEVAIFDMGMDAGGITDLYNGRYNPNDLIVRPGADLTYQATVTNTHPSQGIYGQLVGDSQIVEPPVTEPDLALRFEEEDYIFSFNNGWEAGVTILDCPDDVWECATEGASESNTATCIYGNGTCPTIGEPGYKRYAVRFDGVDDVVTMPSLGPARPGQILAFWIYVDSLPSGGNTATILDTASEETGALDIYLDSSGRLVFDIAGHGTYTSGGSFSGGWYQAIFVKDGSNLTLYRNYNDTTTLTPTPSNVPDIFIGPGTLGNNADGSAPLAGRLDDLVFYNEFFPNQSPDYYYSHIRNARYSYEGEIAPSFLLEFDENLNPLTPTVFLNGVGWDLVCDSAATCPVLTTDGYEGEAAVFDGVDDYIPLFGSGGPILSDPHDGLKIEGWFKLDQLPASAVTYILDASDFPSSSLIMPRIYVGSTGRVGISLKDGAGIGWFAAGPPDPVFTPANLGQWIYLEFWFYEDDVNDRIQYAIEVDNVLAASGAYNYAPDQFDLWFGGGRIGSDIDGLWFFNGSIDHLIIQPLMNERTDYDIPFDAIGEPDVQLVNRVTDGKTTHCDLAIGACPVREDNGRFDSTFNFDGDDYFLVDDVAAGHFAQSDYTIAAWFKTADGGTEQDILAAVDPVSGGHGVLLEITPGGNVRYLHRFPTGTGGGSNIYSPATYNDGQWHHLTAVRQGSNMALYVDNSLVGTNTAVDNATGALDIVIGRLSPTLDMRYFNGRLDELLILPEAVSEDGVNLLYNTIYPNILVDEDFVPYSAAPLSTVVVTGTAQVSDNAITSIHSFEEEVEAALDTGNIDVAATDPNAANLLVYIPFEDVPGTTMFENVIDTRDPGCTAVACPTAGLRGIVDRAAYFDGTSDYLDFNITDRENIRTIATWVKADGGAIADFRASAVYEMWGIQIDFDKFQSFESFGATDSLDIDLPENEWAHLAVTFEQNAFPTPDGINIYVNGQLQSTTSVDSVFVNSSYYPTIGADKDAANFLHGYLDDFRVYNVTLSPADVQALYEQTAPVMRFEFDEEGDATVFEDSSVNEAIGFPSSETCAYFNLSQITVDTVMAPPASAIVISLDGEPLWGASGVFNIGDILTPAIRVPFCGSQTLSITMSDQFDTADLTTAVLNAANTGSFNQTFDGPPGMLILDWNIGDVFYKYNPAPGTEGKIGNTALFDGNGIIDVPDAGDTVDLIANFTIMTWVKTTETAVGLLAKNDSDTTWESGEKLFYLDNNGYPTFVGFGNSYIQSATAVNDDIWHQVAVTWDASSGTGRIFVDGLNVTSSDTYAANNPDNGGDTIKIGAPNYGEAPNSFAGQLDELAVYGRALTAGELFSIYLRELRWYRDHGRQLITVDNDDPTIDLLTDHPYRANGYIQLAVATADLTSRVVLLDMGVKAPGDSDFTWQNAPVCEDAGLKGITWCPYFDTTQLSNEGVYEIQFRAVDVVGHETASSVYTFYVDGTPPTVGSSYNDYWVPAASTPNTDLAWTVTLNGTISDPDLAGGISGSGVVTDMVLISLVDGRGRILNGTPQKATINGDTWTIDYVISGERPSGTYNIEVTATDEVGNDLPATDVGLIRLDRRPPLVDLDRWQLPGLMISDTLTLNGVIAEQPGWGGAAARYHFDEVTASATFYDHGLWGNHATCVNCPIPAAGQFGGALSFDGLDDVLTVPDSETLDFDGSFSLSLWARRANWNSDRFFLGKGDDLSNPSSANYVFATLPSGALVLSYYSNGWQNIVDNSGTTFASNVWTHLALVVDTESNKVRFYKDGILLSEHDQDFNTYPLLTNDEPLTIGHYLNNSSATFAGQLDELNLYGRALSTAEVSALAQTVSSGVNSVEVGLEIVDFDALTVTQSISWTRALLDNSGANLLHWNYPLPTGLENFYQMHLRGADTFGNTSSVDLIWRGAIDLLAPRVLFTAQHVGSGAAAQTEYTFNINDLFVDESSLEHPCHDADLVYGYFDNPARTNQISATCRVPGHETNPVSVTVCDYAQHCTTETITPATNPVYEGNVVITYPLNHTVISTTVPVNIQGGANQLGGIDALTVYVDNAPVDTVVMGGAVTDTTWAVDWSPPGPGTYTITAVMTDTGSVTYLDTVRATLTGYVLDVTPAGNGSGTVTSNPTGIDCGLDCAEAYAPGTVVTATAVADTGSVFNGWSGACTGTGDCTLTMNEMHAVTATFALPAVNVQPANLTLTETGVTTGTFMVTLDALPAAAVTITLTTDDASECTVSPGQLVLDATNWQTGVSATVASVDDNIEDGDQTCTVITSLTESNDLYQDGLAVDDVTVTVIDDDDMTFIHLPVVMNNYPAGPDLVVDALTVTSNSIEVTISNQGDTAVTNAFWVDVYIDPNSAPTGVNQTIQTLNSDGAVWGIAAGALPLAPGETLTLTLNDAYYQASASQLNFPIAAGTAVYAQVDSAHPTNSYGAVWESHERFGGAYNNILATTSN